MVEHDQAMKALLGPTSHTQSISSGAALADGSFLRMRQLCISAQKNYVHQNVVVLVIQSSRFNYILNKDNLLERYSIPNRSFL